MKRVVRAATLVAALAVGVTTTARADGFMRWDVCGGNAFNTCASVEVNVVGTTVTMRVWNLSGMSGSGTFQNTVFTGIGLFNLPNTVDVAATPNFSVWGPVRGTDTPVAEWAAKSNKQIGGGVTLDIVSTSQNVDGGIASGCAVTDGSVTPNLPGGSNDLFMNPCATGLPLTGDAGWVTFQFDVTATFDPSTTQLLVKGQNGPNGASTECITGAGGNCSVVPEPISMVLLGTGLAGLGAIRRRKRKLEV